MSTTLRSKRAGETRTVFVDLGPKLSADELLTGTPTVEEIGSSDLTITGVGLNVLDETVAGRLASVDQAVVFTVAGGVAGTEYRLRITAGTDADTAQTLIQDIAFRVN